MVFDIYLTCFVKLQQCWKEHLEFSVSFHADNGSHYQRFLRAGHIELNRIERVLI